jgi:transcriptional regulator with PAS, ATPase and Fis domain
MERAVTLCSGSVIEMQHLPLDFQQPIFQVQRYQRRELNTLEANEKEYIAWVVKQVNGNKTKAAEILGIDRVSLWRKLKRYDLNGES